MTGNISQSTPTIGDGYSFIEIVTKEELPEALKDLLLILRKREYTIVALRGDKVEGGKSENIDKFHVFQSEVPEEAQSLSEMGFQPLSQRISGREAAESLLTYLVNHDSETRPLVRVAIRNDAPQTPDGLFAIFPRYT